MGGVWINGLLDCWIFRFRAKAAKIAKEGNKRRWTDFSHKRTQKRKDSSFRCPHPVILSKRLCSQRSLGRFFISLSGTEESGWAWCAARRDLTSASSAGDNGISSSSRTRRMRCCRSATVIRGISSMTSRPAARQYSLPLNHFNQLTTSLAEYVTMTSAPARRMARRLSIVTARSSIQPLAAAALIIAYSALTAYAAVG
jgi:hypothetical protein